MLTGTLKNSGNCEVKIFNDVSVLLHSIWEFLSKTFSVCSFGLMTVINVFLPVSSTFWKKCLSR